MEKVSKKAINYWRLQAGIQASIAIIVIIVSFILYYFFPILKWGVLIVELIAVLYFLYEIVYKFWFHPKLFFKYYRFQITEDELVVNSGIFNRKHTVIPLFRIQNVDVTEGPIMKSFGLKGVEITTAGGGTYIPELEANRADELRHTIRAIVNERKREHI